MFLNKSLFILALPLVLSFQDNSKTIRLYCSHSETINGKVKQLIEMGIDLRGSPFLMSYSDTTSFDKKGNEIEMRSGWSDGLYDVTKYNFKYNNDGTKIEILDRPGISKTIRKYNKNGNLIESFYYNQDGIYQTEIYTYDTMGNISQTDTYDKLNVLKNKTIYKYGNKGFLLEEDSFPLAAKYNSIVLYEYKVFDKRSNWTKEIRTMKSSNDTAAFLTDTIKRKITYY